MQVRLGPEQLTIGKAHRQSESGTPPVARVAPAEAALARPLGRDSFPAWHRDMRRPVESGFWRGACIAAPVCALLWIAILLAIAMW